MSKSEEAEKRGSPLPRRAFLTLTEALTWIQDRDCRTDGQLRQEGKESFALNRRAWGTAGGPQALLPHLERLAEGRTWSFDDDDDLMESERQNLLLGYVVSQRWLEENGLSAAEGLARVQKAIAEQQEHDRQFERLLELLRDQCAAGSIALLGIEKTRDGAHPAGRHETIPTHFFLRPIFAWMGFGYSDAGVLSPARLDEDDTIDAILRGEDRRSDYLKVQISREDTLQLDRLFHGLPSPPSNVSPQIRQRQPSKRYSVVKIDAWYQDRVANWPEDQRPPTVAQDWSDAKSLFPGVSRDAIREARRRFAPESWTKKGARRKKN
jgi:hypothetical protein